MQLSVEEKRELAEVYEKAAEYLEEYGLAKGTAGYPSGSKCILGAIRFGAANCQQRSLGDDTLPLFWRCRDFLRETLEIESVLEWNDDPTRTKDEVINTLHALANKLR